MASSARKMREKIIGDLRIPGVFQLSLVGLNVDTMLSKGMPVKGVLLMVLLILCMPGLTPNALDVVELFCGAAAVSRACARAGLRVKSMDICIDKVHDLLTPAGFGSAPHQLASEFFWLLSALLLLIGVVVVTVVAVARVVAHDVFRFV